MIMDGKPLNENERMSLLRTIEGDAGPHSHDFVSNLLPKSDERTMQSFEHDPIAIADGLRDTWEVLGKDQNALKLRLQIAAECILYQAERIAQLKSKGG
jgi:hypothetical protein